jgi:hypothetical protein
MMLLTASTESPLNALPNIDRNDLPQRRMHEDVAAMAHEPEQEPDGQAEQRRHLTDHSTDRRCIPRKLRVALWE